MDRTQLEKLLSHPVFVITFTCLCLFSILSLRESSKKALVSKESIQKLEESTEIAEKELNKEKEKLNEKQEAIILEKIMRNELLLKKEGEIVLQIPDKEDSTDHVNEDLELKKTGPLEEWGKLMLF